MRARCFSVDADDHLEIVIQTHHQQVLALVVQPMVLSAASRPADDLAGALIAGEDWPCRPLLDLQSRCHFDVVIAGRR